MAMHNGKDFNGESIVKRYAVLVWSLRQQVWINGCFMPIKEKDVVIRTTSTNADFCEIDWRP